MKVSCEAACALVAVLPSWDVGLLLRHAHQYLKFASLGSFWPEDQQWFDGWEHQALRWLEARSVAGDARASFVGLAFYGSGVYSSWFWKAFGLHCVFHME